MSPNDIHAVDQTLFETPAASLAAMGQQIGIAFGEVGRPGADRADPRDRRIGPHVVRRPAVHARVRQRWAPKLGKA